MEQYANTCATQNHHRHSESFGSQKNISINDLMMRIDSLNDQLSKIRKKLDSIENHLLRETAPVKWSRFSIDS